MSNVKPICAIITAFVVSTTSLAHAADPQADTPESSETQSSKDKKPPARFGVSVNPLGILLGVYIAEFDYGLDDRTSLNVNGSYFDFELLGVETTAWGLGVGVQYFPQEIADSGPLYQGFYIYPSLQYARVTVSEPFLNTQVSGSSIAPQAVAGWQWDWRPWSVRLGGGAAYWFGDVSGDDLSSALGGLELVLDGSVGLTFGG
jgi:hypothetical protein